MKNKNIARVLTTITASLLVGVSATASSMASEVEPQIDAKVNLYVDSMTKNAIVPVITRSTFAWTTKGELSEDIQTLLADIKEEKEHTLHKILKQDVGNNVVVFKTQEENGWGVFIYDTEWKDSISLTTGILEDYHPYVHVEHVSPDAIYWSYFPKENPKEKIFHEFSLKDRENKPLETPSPLFNINFERNKQLFGTAFYETGGRSLYMKTPNEAWEKIIEELDKEKAISLQWTKVNIIEKDSFKKNKSEKESEIFLSNVNNNELLFKYQLRTISSDGTFGPLFTLSSSLFGDPFVFSLKVKNTETDTYERKKIVLIPTESRGRVSWQSFCDNYHVGSSLLSSIHNTIQGTGIEDFYFQSNYFGIEIIQDNSLRFSNVFALTKDEYPDFEYFIVNLKSIKNFIKEIDRPKDQQSSRNTEIAQDKRIQDIKNSKDKFAKSAYEFINMDDDMLYCLVTKPPFGTDNYPAVIMPHGGPHVPVMRQYDSLAQFLANRGYVVIEPVFAGSYNNSFEFERGRGQYGDLIQREMNVAAKWYSDKGLINPEKVGIIGGSFGGYVVNYQFTHPKEFKDIFPEGFKCFISLAGMSDLSKHIEEHKEHILKRNRLGIPSQIQYIEPLIQDIYAPLTDEAKESLKKNSPLFSAENGKGHLLLLHSAKDKTVSVEHSNLFSKALTDAGISHTYGIFECEGHNFKRSDNINVYYSLIEKFLDKHLGDGKRVQLLTQEEVDKSSFHFIKGEDLLN